MKDKGDPAPLPLSYQLQLLQAELILPKTAITAALCATIALLVDVVLKFQFSNTNDQWALAAFIGGVLVPFVGLVSGTMALLNPRTKWSGFWLAVYGLAGSAIGGAVFFVLVYSFVQTARC